MDTLASRILRERVAPVLEEMLAPDKAPIGEKKFEWTKDLVCLAKELLECDVLLKKLGKPDPMPEDRDNPKYMHNPQPSPYPHAPATGM